MVPRSTAEAPPDVSQSRHGDPEKIDDQGFDVEATVEPGSVSVTAVNNKTGERFDVTNDDGDIHAAAVEMAKLVGVDPMDG